MAILVILSPTPSPSIPHHPRSSQIGVGFSTIIRWDLRLRRPSLSAKSRCDLQPKARLVSLSEVATRTRPCPIFSRRLSPACHSRGDRESVHWPGHVKADSHRYCGCPILCGPPICSTYPADCAAKGGITKPPPLTLIPNTMWVPQPLRPTNLSHVPERPRPQRVGIKSLPCPKDCAGSMAVAISTTLPVVVTGGSHFSAPRRAGTYS